MRATERTGCLASMPLILVLLLLWEAITRIGLLSPVFFPPATVVAATLWRLFGSGDLAGHAGRTLSRMICAFSVGAGTALVLGLCMGWSRRLRRVFDPLVAAFHPVPKTALLPLFMILVGMGDGSKIAVAALAAFFPMLINAMAGVCQISPVHFEVAQNFGASPGKVFARVVLPGSLPMVMAGARVAFNSALVVTIAVELLTARRGLGAVIWQAWETMRTEELYAAITVSAVIGIGCSALLARLTDWLVPWQVRQEI